MSAILPYPDKPANGQAPDATPILANFLALLQAVQSFDASQIQAGTITDAAFADAVNPRLRAGKWMPNWIESGGYTSAFTTLSWVMPSGFAWTNGYRAPFTGQSYTVAASQDTYYFVSQTGTVTVSAVSNNAAAPSIPSNAQPIIKVVSNGTTITSMVDLRVTSPVANTLGYVPITSDYAMTSTTITQVPGLTYPIVVPSGRRVKITVAADVTFNSTVGTWYNSLSIWDGTVGTGTRLQLTEPGANASGLQLPVNMVAAPLLSAGFHTINVGMMTSGGTATVRASATSPFFLLIEVI